MKILFACGSHPRHAYMARKLAESGHLAGLIMEQREVHIPEPAPNLNDNLRHLFRLHFERRAAAENRFFSVADFPHVETLTISPEQLNGNTVHEMIQDINPDLLLSYGVHILSPETLALVHGEAWNIHGGLSPWYRGCITHFWPSYFLQPQMTGMTVHDLTQALDAGPVVHQSVAPLVKGDGLHDLSCRAVKALADEIADLINVLETRTGIVKHTHKTSGRIWRACDWHPVHLKLIYETYNDRIVDQYLDGLLMPNTPDLIRAI